MNSADMKLMNSVAEGKTYCSCGHSIVMLPSTNKTICTYCGHTVKNKSISRFRYMFWKIGGNKNGKIKHLSKDE